MLGEFNAQNVASMAWAYETRDEKRSQSWRVRRSVTLGKFNAQHVASIAWAFAKAE